MCFTGEYFFEAYLMDSNGSHRQDRGATDISGLRSRRWEALPNKYGDQHPYAAVIRSFQRRVRLCDEVTEPRILRSVCVRTVPYFTGGENGPVRDGYGYRTVRAVSPYCTVTVPIPTNNVRQRPPVSSVVQRCPPADFPAERILLDFGEGADHWGHLAPWSYESVQVKGNKSCGSLYIFWEFSRKTNGYKTSHSAKVSYRTIRISGELQVQVRLVLPAALVGPGSSAEAATSTGSQTGVESDSRPLQGGREQRDREGAERRIEDVE
ncbi:hypothetical protein R3P38DRAFT_3570542 [Favolaschia claudopus]|uniref:Uncharacterized protein n=1 Tax=Favolaschia claudopus TaxID=2862362 RepID=A0AAW0APJ1_9AGAR